ncbi:MAG: phage tail protein [Treponema sp.]|nr:phage tail protein [Treponema sp.]
MDFENIRHSCVGLDVYSAKNKILSLCPELSEEDIDITYQESEYKRFIVFDCKQVKNKIMLYATSKNPIRNLPSIYQENDFLRNFLMIFQHINNDIAIKIDNMNEMFRPMHCPADFLDVLANWFGIDVDLLGSENEKRLLLQYAIPLFKLRGTALGLKIYIYILTGIVPKILENYIPYSSLEIIDGTSVSSSIFEQEKKNAVFTVAFPIYREEMDENLLKRLTLLLQQEKPVNTDCYISFKRKKVKPRKKTVITDKTTVNTTFEF